MSEKWCCVTYQELGPELIQVKSDIINGQMQDLGLPRSIFAGVIKVLNNMLNYCPVCGECLNKELQVSMTPLKTGTSKVLIRSTSDNEPADLVIEDADLSDKPIISAQDAAKSKALASKLSGNTPRICNGCAGKGVLGRDQNGVTINCMKCHGTGKFVPAKHDCKYNEQLAANAENKVTDLRAKLEIGENPVLGEAE